jgi:hypothetical protein
MKAEFTLDDFLKEVLRHTGVPFDYLGFDEDDAARWMEAGDTPGECVTALMDKYGLISVNEDGTLR